MNKQQGKTIVGLTGNIATGKSAITKLAEERGAFVIDADRVVHALLNGSDAIQEQVAAAFGDQVRRRDGRVNRPVLAQIVFNDPAALRRLEAIVHPAVSKAVHQQISASKASVIFIEAIKLLEGRLVELCDQVWVAHCSAQRQLDRLLICRGMDEETARMRIDAQAPQMEKVERADTVIDTSGTLAETREQVETAWPLPEVLETEPPPRYPRADKRSLARRARASDVPGVLLLIQRATGGEVRMKRNDLLMAFSERSFFLGQREAAINCVFGAYVEGGITRIDQLYIHPPEAIQQTAPAVLDMIDQSAQEHFCELILVFPPTGADAALLELLEAFGYRRQEKETMHPVWQRAVDESQPEETFVMVKVLRDIRNVARL